MDQRKSSAFGSVRQASDSTDQRDRMTARGQGGQVEGESLKRAFYSNTWPIGIEDTPSKRPCSRKRHLPKELTPQQRVFILWVVSRLKAWLSFGRWVCPLAPEVNELWLIDLR